MLTIVKCPASALEAKTVRERENDDDLLLDTTIDTQNPKIMSPDFHVWDERTPVEKAFYQVAGIVIGTSLSSGSIYLIYWLTL